jgi:hypothetical protein
MRRSPAIAQLSRDHQHALAAALRLRRADASTVSAAIAAFTDFFEAEGLRHFAIEEALILPAIPQDDVPGWSEGVERVRRDHAAIRRQAAALAATDGITDRVQVARALGEDLGAHVRFEERVLFEILERRLSAAELERLGAAIAKAEAETPPR